MTGLRAHRTSSGTRRRWRSLALAGAAAALTLPGLGCGSGHPAAAKSANAGGSSTQAASPGGGSPATHARHRHGAKPGVAPVRPASLKRVRTTPSLAAATAASGYAARLPTQRTYGNGPVGSGHGPTLAAVNAAVGVYAKRLDRGCLRFRAAEHHPPSSLEQQAASNPAVVKAFVVDLSLRWLRRIGAIAPPAMVRNDARAWIAAERAAIDAFSASNTGNTGSSPVLPARRSNGTPRYVKTYAQAAADADRATRLAQRVIGFDVCGTIGSPWL